MEIGEGALYIEVGVIYILNFRLPSYYRPLMYVIKDKEEKVGYALAQNIAQGVMKVSVEPSSLVIS